MTRKIFRSILLASVLSLVASLLMITGVLYEYFGDVEQKGLEAEFRFASAAVEKSGQDYLASVQTENYRLTWISEDGTVLFDTSAEADGMDNHADREEIREAFETGRGESARYSATLTEKTLYYAGLLSDGTVLRVSTSQLSALSIILGMVRPLVIVFAILLILSALLSHRMSRQIVEPLNTIDIEHPLDSIAYEELSPLLRRVHQLNGQVGLQLEELKRRTDEFEQIIGNMNESLVLLDEDGIVVSINNAAQKLFGVDGGCVGSDFLTVDRSMEAQEALRVAMADGHGEMRTARNGGEYQFDISRIEFGGRVIGAVLLAFDVTEKVFAERNRREFTANVSHELKTPLQAIMGSAELLENGMVKQEDVPRFVGHIRAESARLLSLIEDIIKLSQLDEQCELTREQTDLYALASETISVLRCTAEGKSIALTLTGESVVVDGVKKLLSEVIFNLCDNAIKYTDVGGKVEINVRRDAANAVLTVSDTGIGIPPEHQARVFERFYRVDKSHSKASGGTGLGLSIVKHAVLYHHGSVSLHSEPGHGSEFIVTLPIR